MTKDQAKPGRQAILRWGGVLLLILCLAYFVRALLKLDLRQLVATLGWSDWLAAALVSIIYGVGLLLLAIAWMKLASPERKIAYQGILAIYGPGVLAKYLPGSVFQYASRQMVGAQHGLPHGAMAKASVLEVTIHVGLALAMAAALVAGWSLGGLGAGVVVGVVMVAISKKPILSSFAYQLLFFCIFAAIVILLGNVGGLANDPGKLAGYFFIAWTAGLLIPIAPGGIGVREAAFLAIASPYESVDAIVLVALLSRLIGTAGDGLFGFAGYLAMVRSSRENRQASG